MLAFGGSPGAERLNDALVALAERVARDLPHVTLTFAAGKRDYDRTAANLKGSAAAGAPASACWIIFTICRCGWRRLTSWCPARVP